MPRSSNHPPRTAGTAALVLLCVAGLVGSVGHLTAEPGEFDTREVEVTLPKGTLHLNCVIPKTPKAPGVMILFATGDDGWMGTSKPIFNHLAEEGYYVAAINSRTVLKEIKRQGEMVTPKQGWSALATIIAEAKHGLNLPDETLTIPTGFSRGASMVVFVAADPTLQPKLAGAVAIALTRELDYLKVPPGARSPSIQVDEKGRLQTYPALVRVGPVHLAVIQSTGDKYVPAAEARKLFGPDTPTRRLYSVEASNHGFGGGRDDMFKDLDDALAWINSASARP